jgi:hypothetical protein
VRASRSASYSAQARLGAAVSPNLVIAAESNGWVKTVDGAESQLGTLAAVAQWYPTLTNGFFVKGGLGFSMYTEKEGGFEAKAVGPGYQVGTGYDFRVGRNFSLTPYVNFLAMADADVKLNGTSLNEKIGTTNVQYGIGFTWH